MFVGGGRRYNVCELCKPHALHEGWMREGAIPEFQGGPDRAQRRRSLFGRRRDAAPSSSAGGIELGLPDEPRTLDDELSYGELGADRGACAPAPVPVAPSPASRRRGERLRATGAASGGGAYREPRHVHAIPTNGDHKIAAAVEVFNASEHRRTVAGVARSLGAPDRQRHA